MLLGLFQREKEERIVDSGKDERRDEEGLVYEEILGERS
jgi:hypothetical protein